MIGGNPVTTHQDYNSTRLTDMPRDLSVEGAFRYSTFSTAHEIAARLPLSTQKNWIKTSIMAIVLSPLVRLFGGNFSMQGRRQTPR